MSIDLLGRGKGANGKSFVRMIHSRHETASEKRIEQQLRYQSLNENTFGGKFLMNNRGTICSNVLMLGNYQNDDYVKILYNHIRLLHDIIRNNHNFIQGQNCNILMRYIEISQIEASEYFKFMRAHCSRFNRKYDAVDSLDKIKIKDAVISTLKEDSQVNLKKQTMSNITLLKILLKEASHISNFPEYENLVATSQQLIDDNTAILDKINNDEHYLDALYNIYTVNQEKSLV